MRDPGQTKHHGHATFRQVGRCHERKSVRIVRYVGFQFITEGTRKIAVLQGAAVVGLGIVGSNRVVGPLEYRQRCDDVVGWAGAICWSGYAL